MSATGLNRNNEKFYTKKKIAETCCSFLKDKITIDKEDLIIEPSAGDGSFIDSIKLLTKNYQFYDIEPQNFEIIKKDFLKLDIEKKNRKIHIVGNPPFGRQSSIAKKFIKKCSLFANSISFILPKSFKKESFQKTFPLCFHLIHEYDLPENSFIVEDKEYNVPCVFQIWIKKDYNRELEEKQVPKNFKFVNKEDDHDISIRRVGVYAGQIDTDTENKSVSSHYFIKFSDKKLLEKLEEFKSIKFSSDNTVGPRSISKPELIKEFNKISN